MAQYMGQFEHLLDGKGRLTLPSLFRPHFPGENGGVLIAGEEGCVVLWDRTEWSSRYRDLAAAARDASQEVSDRARWLISMASDVTVDAQGRMPIPPSLRQWGGLSLEEPVLVIGSFDHVELWHPSDWRPFQPQPTRRSARTATSTSTAEASPSA